MDAVRRGMRSSNSVDAIELSSPIYKPNKQVFAPTERCCDGLVTVAPLLESMHSGEGMSAWCVS